jgi:hypothetical protein
MPGRRDDALGPAVWSEQIRSVSPAGRHHCPTRDDMNSRVNGLPVRLPAGWAGVSKAQFSYFPGTGLSCTMAFFANEWTA